MVMEVPIMASLFGIEIKKLKGVGPKSAECLKALGVNTVGDLIKFYPRAYEDWCNVSTLSEAIGGGEKCFRLKIISSAESIRTRSGKYVYKLNATDGNHFVDVIFFGNKYVAQSLKKGEEYLFRGAVQRSKLKLEIISPKVKHAREDLKLYPIYNQTKGINSSKIEKFVREALDLLPENIPETLPDDILLENNLCSLGFAIRNIHFPSNFYDLKRARSRIIFEEFLIYQLGMKLLKKQSRKKTRIKITKSFAREFESFLPFKLTKAQKEAIKECESDLKSGFAMNRLLQGDVGSGKTAVAASVMYSAVKSGYQVAIMAPTEILAMQHYKTFSSFFEHSNIKVGILYGLMKSKEKTKTLEDIANGDISVVVGTHSLISGNVNFKNLGFIVTDEQHRFGVKQREALINKGNNLHVLVMSATPIPRTLAMILYGDLDISVISETIPGRQKIDTYKITSEKRTRAWNFLKDIIKNGGQGYIVCACIEENENEIVDVLSYKEKMIKEGFNAEDIEILHGKMPSKEKEDVMQRFIDGKVKIIISTTVIEVGVNVPNAQVMIIENAERFGISQLHQLRGRVGRSNKKSYCILISDSKSKDSLRRLKAMVDSNDGFYLSEEDLKLRGPGDFFGVNQHGVPNLGIPTSYDDMELMKKAQKSAEDIVFLDGDLLDPKFKYIKRRLKDSFSCDNGLEFKNVIF